MCIRACFWLCSIDIDMNTDTAYVFFSRKMFLIASNYSQMQNKENLSSVEQNAPKTLTSHPTKLALCTWF